MNCGQIRQRRGIYLTQEIWTYVKFDIGNLFIGELFITSESKTLDFSNSGIFVDGRNKEKRIGNCHTIKMKSMVFRYTWVYSKEDTMAHTYRPMVTS